MNKAMRQRPLERDITGPTQEPLVTGQQDREATCPDDGWLRDFPAIARLRVTPSELGAVRRQGHISRERRGALEISKLRFRLAGRQCVRYIGADGELALEVANELARLQHGRRVELALSQKTKLAAETLRDIKKTLEPLLAEEGLHFYGLELRRRRTDRRTNR